MIKDNVKTNQPVKCTLIRIMESYESIDNYKTSCTNILKNYIYVPEKKIIA